MNSWEMIFRALRHGMRVYKLPILDRIIETINESQSFLWKECFMKGDVQIANHQLRRSELFVEYRSH